MTNDWIKNPMVPMQQRWFILIAVACGTFMATLDSSIVNVALPSITESFLTDLLYSRWVVIAYLFSITGLLLFFGKLADILGRRLVFGCGYFIFTFGSLLCGMSHSMKQLILYRGVQGLGASMLMANGPAIITAAFSKNERGKALGTLAMVVSVGLAIGPTLGGFLVKHFSWPSIFYVNIPFGLLGIWFVIKYVPINLGMPTHSDLERESQLPILVRVQTSIERLRYFDWLGAILWMFLQFGYSLALDHEDVLGIAGPIQRIIIFASFGLLFLFLIWEWSVEDPVLDLTLFKSRTFLASNISSLFSFIGISGVTLLMPFYFQNIRGLAPDKVGLFMTAIPLTIFVIAPISGRISDKYGSRLLSALGMILLCFSMFLLFLPWEGLLSENHLTLLFYLVLVGAGVGLFQSPNNNTIMGAVPRSHLGVASALLATTRNLGLVTGVAFSSSLLNHFHKIGESFTTSLRYTFLSLSLLCSIGIFASLLNEAREKREYYDPEGGHRRR